MQDRLEKIIAEVVRRYDANTWCLPNWPLKLFLRDIDMYPPKGDLFYISLYNATDNYLLFFSESRGYDRPFGYYIDLWSVLFSNSDVILYMNDEISYILGLSPTEHLPEDENISIMLQLLSKNSRDQWSTILSNLSSSLYHPNK